MSAIRLYFRFALISIRGQLQYRASFIMMSLGHFLSTVIDILFILALFHRFGALRDWRLAEVALFYGLIQTAFALAESLGRGFDVFPELIKTGEFDRVLLQPRSPALLVAAREVQLMRIGRFSQGLIVLIWAASALNVAWSLGRTALVLFTVAGGMCMFYGLFVLQATISFWTIESLELMNTVTYGGNETGQFPITIYQPWFRKFFTYLIPLACVTYFPVLAILGKPDPFLGSPLWFQVTAPLAGFLFLLITLRIWRFGVRHYTSAGS